MKISTRNFEFRLNFSFWRKQEKAHTYGSTNRTYDGFYIPYIDYDRVPLKDLIPELDRLQSRYCLGDLHVFKSSPKGFHVIGFDKLPAHIYLEILQQSSCDQAFRDVPRWYSPTRAWILRHTEKGKTNKPSYVTTLHREGTRRQSRAHHALVNKLYGKISPLKYPDNSKRVTGVKYETSNNTKNEKKP